MHWYSEIPFHWTHSGLFLLETGFLFLLILSLNILEYLDFLESIFFTVCRIAGGNLIHILEYFFVY